jgi:short-subunit dehydrogenase
LAARGHQVLLTDLDGDAVDQAAHTVGDSAWGTVQDVGDPSSHQTVAALAAERGRLAVWVNNAAILHSGNCWEQSPKLIDQTLNVNVLGVVAGSAAAVTTMGTEGGAILNLASLSALAPVPGLAVYAATKAAVLSFTTSLQGELDHAGLPIRARALCPDVAATSMLNGQAHDSNAALLFAGPKPLTPEAVAQAGMDLVDSAQIYRAIPRWRGLISRTTGIAPAAAIRFLPLLRSLGERHQRRL